MSSVLGHWNAVGPTKRQQWPSLCSNICQGQYTHGNEDLQRQHGAGRLSEATVCWSVTCVQYRHRNWVNAVRTIGMEEERVDVIASLWLTAEIGAWICSTSQRLLWACIYVYKFPHRLQPPPRGYKQPMYVYPIHVNITFLTNYRKAGD